jgi:FPC/CPF motif-containing protein YcgG
VDNYRQTDQTYQSAAVIFRQPTEIDETMFDAMLWQRLEAIRRIDEQNYAHDPRVDNDPQSSKYSFSLKEEAFFVLGLNPASRRNSRRFSYPTLVFNPHQQFEILRQRDQYGKLKNIVRKKDLSFSGSINPMLDDFGKASEVYQYSGLEHGSDWTCPLRKKYA